jgi:hypothetical protein
MPIARTWEESWIFRLPEGSRRSDLLLIRFDATPSKPIRQARPRGRPQIWAAGVYSAIDLRTHFSITSAIWSEFFSNIIIWPLP